MRLIHRLKSFERNYVFLRWATGAEYGKLMYVGEDYVEFNILDVDTMEYRETVIINAQLILEAVFGGSDISRIVAEISSMIEEAYEAGMREFGENTDLFYYIKEAI